MEVDTPEEQHENSEEMEIQPSPSIFNVIHPSINRDKIPPHILNEGIRIRSCIKLAIKCNKYLHTQYSDIDRIGSGMTACGYTSAAIAVSFIQLELLSSYRLSEMYAKLPKKLYVKEKKNVDGIETVICRTVKGDEYMTIGINEAVGYLWNRHFSKCAGIDYLYNKNNELFSTTLEIGCNLVSFFNPEPVDGIFYSVHHSFIFYDSEYCIIVDSWGDPTVNVFRYPSSRLYLTEDVLQKLRKINDVETDRNEFHTIMYEYFLASNVAHIMGTYTQLNCVVLNQKYLKHIAIQGFDKGMCGLRSWGGTNTKTKTKTNTKTNTKTKTKTKTTKNIKKKKIYSAL